MCWRILHSTYGQLIQLEVNGHRRKKTQLAKTLPDLKGLRRKFHEVPEEFKYFFKKISNMISPNIPQNVQQNQSPTNQSFTSSSHAFAKSLYLPGLPRVAPPHTVPHPVVHGALRKPCGWVPVGVCGVKLSS